MKPLFTILIIIALSLLWQTGVLAENWGAWQGTWGREKPNAQKKDASHPAEAAEATTRLHKAEQQQGSEERYCSFGEEGELLKLLDKLKEIKGAKGVQSGGRSVVRQKYRIARKLRKYDDCRAEDALKELIKENECEDLDEGEIFCVAWGAKPSLQEISSKKDLKKLSPAIPLADQLKVIKKYGQHPHTNEVASHAVRDFLISQAPANPDLYVPLLVEYFTHSPMVIGVASQFPQAADKGIANCFRSSHPSTVWHAVQLARTLGRPEFLQPVFGVAFEKKGSFNYDQPGDVETIQTAALSYFRTFESQALPYYEKILHGGTSRIQEYLISGIHDLGNPKLLSLLKEFAVRLQEQPGLAPSLLRTRLHKKIALMEEAQK